MKIAVLADIHSNAQALEAVLADARAERADLFVVAGDLITDGPASNRVLDFVREASVYVIKGNREEYMMRIRGGQSPGWDDRKQFAALAWAYRNLKASDYDYISSLPEQLSLLLEGYTAIRVVHGSPFSISELLKPYEDMAAVERSARAVEEPVLIFGHNHIQWTGEICGKLLFNPGSVGVHFNREIRAEYGMLHLEDGRIRAELKRVPYDFAALERELETSGLANAAPVWTKITFEGVKAGRNYCLDFLRDAGALMQKRGISSPAISDGVWDAVAERWWREKGWGKYQK